MERTGCRYGCESLTERHVQAIWYDRDFRPESVVARDGTRIWIVHPGDWNLGPGPDFKNAVIEVGAERRRVSGDVEVHLKPSDWDSHGHASDPRYGNVVLHLTWDSGENPHTLPSGTICVSIGAAMKAIPWFSPEQIDVSAYPFSKMPSAMRPCHERMAENPDLAREVLAAAGEYRIRRKAKRFAAVLSARRGDRIQVFYEETMAAFGYGGNSKAFRRLAENVPYSMIAAEPGNMEVAASAAAGFLDFRRGGCRPNNSPRRRLASALRLFSSTEAVALADVSCFSRKECRRIVSLLAAKGGIGRGRAAAILANVILPFAIAECRVASVPDWLPPEDVSAPARTMAFRMFGRDHNPSAWYASNGLLIQGVLQTYRDYCLKSFPDCEKCGFPVDLDARRSCVWKGGLV